MSGLLKAQRSEDFLAAQRRMLDALLKSRAAEHGLVEIGAKAIGPADAQPRWTTSTRPCTP